MTHPAQDVLNLHAQTALACAAEQAVEEGRMRWMEDPENPGDFGLFIGTDMEAPVLVVFTETEDFAESADVFEVLEVEPA